MPYQIAEWRGEHARKAVQEKPPFGLSITDEEVIARVERVKVTGSSFTDPGDDWVLIEAFDAEGKDVASRKVEGY